MISDELKQRFWAKVAVRTAKKCWLWTASTAGRGYGQIKAPGERRQHYSHRLAYELHYGPIPDGKKVLHRCDTPRCCNPDHLFLGNSGDNARDMAQKGRHLYGERNTQHVLTEREVHRIFDLVEQGKSQASIARALGVGPMTVSRIVRGERWRHVWLKRR